MLPNHPCGSLPVLGVSASLWYCYHHQAWFGLSASYMEFAQDGIESTGGTTIEFGPFDTSADALTWAAEQLAELVPLGFSGDRPTRQRPEPAALAHAQLVSIEEYQRRAEEQLWDADDET